MSQRQKLPAQKGWTQVKFHTTITALVSNKNEFGWEELKRPVSAQSSLRNSAVSVALAAKDDEITKLKEQIAALKAESAAKDLYLERLCMKQDDENSEEDGDKPTEEYTMEELQQFPSPLTTTTSSIASTITAVPVTSSDKVKPSQTSSYTKKLFRKLTPSHLDKPSQYYIGKLQEGTHAISLTFLRGLKSTLQNADSHWISDFLNRDGLIAIERATLAYDDSAEADVTLIFCQCELVNCLFAFLNNKLSLQQVINKGESTMINFMQLLFTSKNIMMKVRLIELVAAMALYSKAGYNLVIRCLEKVEKKQGDQVKFRLFVKLMQETPDPQFKACCMELVNCLVSSPSKLEFRRKVRSFFIHAGILPILEGMQRENGKDENEELTRQVKAFKENLDADELDEHEIMSELQFQLDNPKYMLKEVTTHVEYEKDFLCLLQYLLLIPYDQKPLADVVWSHLLKATRRIVQMEKTDSNKDFARDPFYTILLEDLAESVQKACETSKNSFIAPTSSAAALPASSPKDGSSPVETLPYNSLCHSPASLSLSPSPSPAPSPPAPSPPVSSPPVPSPPVPSPPVPSPPVPSPVPPPPVPSPPSQPPPAHSPSPSPFPSSSSPSCATLSPTQIPPSLARAPPPPPPSKTKSEELLPPKPIFHPPVKLKPFYWNKLSSASALKYPVWTKIASKTEMQINTNEIDRLFFAPDAKINLQATPKTNDQQLKEIFSTKRENSFTIGLLQIKGVTLQQIAQTILLAKDAVLTKDQLEILAKIIPTAEEMEKLKAYVSITGDSTVLGIVERYCLEIEVIPRLDQKINVLLLKHEFVGRIEKLSSEIAAVKNAAVQLIESPSFLLLLEGILAVGNYLNAGSRIAQAYGFKLEALSTITYTRSKGKHNLLHFVIESILRVDKSVLHFAREIKDLPRAAALYLPNLAADLGALTSDVKRIAYEIKSRDSKSATFRTVFKTFLVAAQLEVENVALMMKSMKDTARKMFECYGYYPNASEDPENVTKFFQLIANFKTQFENCVRDLEKERESTEKATVLVKPGAKRTFTKTTVSSGGVLDELRESIKSGNFKTKHVGAKEHKNMFAKDQQGGPKPEEVNTSDVKPSKANTNKTITN